MMDDLENFLDMILGWDDNLSLGAVIFIFISMLDKDWTSLFDKRALIVIKDDLFTNFLIRTTM